MHQFALGVELSGEVLEDRFGSGVRLARSWPWDDNVGKPQLARTEDVCADLVFRDSRPGTGPHVEVATEAGWCATGGCCNLVEPSHRLINARPPILWW